MNLKKLVLSGVVVFFLNCPSVALSATIDNVDKGYKFLYSQMDKLHDALFTYQVIKNTKLIIHQERWE